MHNNGEDIGGNLITFTVGSTEYRAEEGMTFGQWMLSKYYRVGIFTFDDDTINALQTDSNYEKPLMLTGGANLIPRISTSSVIIPGQVYAIDTTGFDD